MTAPVSGSSSRNDDEPRRPVPSSRPRSVISRPWVNAVASWGSRSTIRTVQSWCTVPGSMGHGEVSDRRAPFGSKCGRRQPGRARVSTSGPDRRSSSSPPHAPAISASPMRSTRVRRIGPCWQVTGHERWRSLKSRAPRSDGFAMEPNGEAASAAQSLRAIRVVASIGALVAIAAVVVGFSFGLFYGLGALVALPAVPLLFVLAFEAIRRPGPGATATPGSPRRPGALRR